MIFVFWELLAHIYPSSIIPSFEDSLKALIIRSHESYFWADLKATLYRITIGTFVSLFLGTILGMSKQIREIIYPSMVIMENLPPVVWIVLAILWFSIGYIPPIIVAVVSATPLVFFNVVEGVKAVDVNLLEMFKSFKVNKKDLVFSLYLPSIAPYILSAFSSTLSMNWRVVVMAEAFSSYTGIGQRLWGVYIYGSTEEVYAYVLLIAALGITIEYLIVRLFKDITLRKIRVGEKNIG